VSAPAEAAAETVAETVGLRMDRMYRHQRHIYDLSRKFYLLGRDRLIAGLALAPGAVVCEVGCGTGRNLIALAGRYPEARLFGIDASEEMLKSASAKIARRRLGARIQLAHCLAEALDPAATFGLEAPFDAVIFSYALSMIPSWKEALARALATLAPGGTLAIVDFSEQRALPPWFRAALRRWLALFDVHPRSALRPHLVALAARGRASLAALPLYGDYACILRYRLPDAPLTAPHPAAK